MREIIIGNKYGFLTAIEPVGEKINGKQHYLCECECGKITRVRDDHLYKLETVSCGCKMGKLDLGIDNTYTRLRGTFRHMRNRCYNKKDSKYGTYGARGIKICDEWLNDFNSFYNWCLENGYRNDLTIDRIDNDGDYEPNNVRFITNYIQARNKSTTIYVEHYGKTLAFAEWCDKYNINYKKAYQRFRKGKCFDKIFRN